MELKIYRFGFRVACDGQLNTLHDSGDVVMLADYRGLQRAAADLLAYLDAHDWGTVPEGGTANRLRDLIHTHAVEKMASFPDCPGCEAGRASVSASGDPK